MRTGTGTGAFGATTVMFLFALAFAVAVAVSLAVACPAAVAVGQIMLPNAYTCLSRNKFFLLYLALIYKSIGLLLVEALSDKLDVPLVATRANMDDPEVSKYFYVVSCER